MSQGNLTLLIIVGGLVVCSVVASIASIFRKHGDDDDEVMP